MLIKDTQSVTIYKSSNFFLFLFSGYLTFQNMVSFHGVRKISMSLSANTVCSEKYSKYFISVSWNKGSQTTALSETHFWSFQTPHHLVYLIPQSWLLILLDTTFHVRHKDKIYDINKDLSFQRILGASE